DLYPALNSSYIEKTLLMKYLICTVPVMPLRAKPADSSEMVSQLLFGEAALYLEQKEGKWGYIRNRFDAYEGWAALNQMTPVEQELYETPDRAYTADLFTTVQVNGTPMHLPMGSFLQGLKEDNMQWADQEIV